MIDYKIACIYSKKNLENAIGGDYTYLPFFKNFIIKVTSSLFISQTGVWFERPLDDWDVVLVWDGINDEEDTDKNVKVNFNNIDVFNQKTLVMYHGFPTESEQKLDDLRIFCKRGQHQRREENGYPLLKNFITSWNGNGFNVEEYKMAKQKLFNWFGLSDKLNASLRFLNYSFGGIIGDISILRVAFSEHDLKRKIGDFDSINKQIINLQEQTGTDYYHGLRDLRSTLLQQCGIYVGKR